MRLKPAWSQALSVYVPVRVMASLAALVASTGIPSNVTIAAGAYLKPAYPKWIEAFFGVWERSDALWYFHIARDGYQAGTPDSAFMPLYPLLIRAVHIVTSLPWLFSGLLVSNCAFLIALVGFRELAALDLGDEAAERSCWYLALFPGSFFLLAPYTESLFLALSVYAFLWARKGQWSRACAAAFFTALTRNLGVAIALPLLIELVSQRRAKGAEARKKPARELLYFALIPAALGLLCLYFHLRSGNALAWIGSQQNWQRSALAPWLTLAGGARQAWEFVGSMGGAVYLLEALSVLGALALAGKGFLFPARGRRLPWSYAAWIVLLILPPLLAPYPGRMLMSSTRFVAVMFPLFILLGAEVRGKSTDNFVRIVFSGLYALALGLFVSNQNMF